MWDEIVQFEFLKTTRKYGKAQLYALNNDSTIIQKFKALDDELGKQACAKGHLKSQFLLDVTKYI